METVRVGVAAVVVVVVVVLVVVVYFGVPCDRMGMISSKQVFGVSLLSCRILVELSVVWIMKLASIQVCLLAQHKHTEAINMRPE